MNYPVITKKDFLDKYPFFNEDKDGLIDLKSLKGGRFIVEGYIIDKYYVPYSNYFWYGGRKGKSKSINYDYPGVMTSDFWQEDDYYNDKNIFSKLDLDNIQPQENGLDGDLGAGMRGLPEFSLEELFKKGKVILSIKERRNKAFNKKFNNNILRTEFLSDPSKCSLLIEEVSNNIFDGKYINRWMHVKFNMEDKTISHFDGGVNIYDEHQHKNREFTTLDKKQKDSTHIKLFKINGKLNIKERQEMILKFFIYNELVEEWFSNDSYKKNHKDILKKNLDF